jgi:hypothetical protein
MIFKITKGNLMGTEYGFNCRMNQTVSVAFPSKYLNFNSKIFHGL